MPERSPSFTHPRRWLFIGILLVTAALVGLHGSSSPPPSFEAHATRVLCVVRSGLAMNGVVDRVPEARPMEAPELDSLGIRAFSVPEESARLLRDMLAARPEVDSAWIEGEAQVAATVPNDPEFDAQWAAERIHLPDAWDVTTGSPSVLIGLIDTGVEADHPDLVGNVLPGADFAGATDGRQDDNGHGTGLAGVLVGRGNDGRGFAGVAWNCRLLPVRVAGEFGIAVMSDIARGIVWCVDNGASVVVIGLGGEEGSEAVDRALKYARERNVLVVAPAGNSPHDVELYPGRSPDVVCAAAGGEEDVLAWGAAFGSETDVLAPGEAISASPGSGVTPLGGSSISAAYVGGVAALLRSVAPSLSLDQVRAALVQEGDELIDPPLTEWTGVRSLNAAQTLRRRDTARVDVAVAGIRTLPKSPQPGQTTIVEVTVENRGNTEVRSFSLRVAADGRIIPQDDSGRHEGSDDGDDEGEGRNRSGGDLKIGAKKLIRFRWVPGAGPTSQIEARVSGVRGDVDASNDSRVLAVAVERQVISDVAFTRVMITKSRPDQNRFEILVSVENVGNRDEGPVALRIRVNGVELRHGQRVERLRVARSATRRIPVRLDEVPVDGQVVVQMELANPDSDATPDDNRASLRFLFKRVRRLAGAPPSATVQYAQFPGHNLVTDTPWRVVEGTDALVPVLFFWPGPDAVIVDQPGAANGAVPTVIEVFAVPTPAQVDDNPLFRPLYQERPLGVPSVLIGNQLEVRNENLDVVASHEVVQAGRRLGGGEHRIIMVPLSDITALSPPRVTAYAQAPMTFLRVRVKFTRGLLFGSQQVSNVYSRVHGIEVADENLPDLGGGIYFDAHNHTISEYTRSSYLFAPRKAFGGPLAMLVECGMEYRFVTLEDLPTEQHRLVVTDHNCFFNATSDFDDDPDIPAVGPYENLQPNEEWAAQDRMVGRTQGQEVAMSTGARFGSHTLVYEHSRPFAGPWHGGAHQAGLARNPWLPGTVLNRLLEEDAGYTFPAHPRSGDGINMPRESLDQLLGMRSPGQRFNDLSRVARRTDEFLCRGIQAWNTRQHWRMNFTSQRLMQMNPYKSERRGGFFDVRNPAAGEMRDTFMLWQDLVSHGLVWYSNPPDPAPLEEKNRKMVRKVFGIAGTDAHGDFGYATDTPATLLASLQGHLNVGSDNAWAKVRTYVYEQELDGMKKGISCMTSGPLLRFKLDSEDRFDVSDWPPFWHDTSNSYENDDGFIGGDGPVDGQRTLLYTPDGDINHAAARIEQENTPDFGGRADLADMTWFYSFVPVMGSSTRVGSVSVGGIASSGTARPGQKDGDIFVALPENLHFDRWGLTPWALTLSTSSLERIGSKEAVAFTNPVWCVPVGIDISLLSKANKKIVVKFSFPISMTPSKYEVQVRQLDRTGDSTLAPQPFDPAVPNDGWENRPSHVSDPDITIENGRYSVANRDPLLVDVNEPYPQPGKYTFVVYIRRPKDAAGNEVNTVGRKFETDEAGVPIACSTNHRLDGFVVTPRLVVAGVIQTVRVDLPTQPFEVTRPDGSVEVVPLAATDIGFSFGPLTDVVDGSIQHEGGTTYSMDLSISEFAPQGQGSIEVHGRAADRDICFELADAFETLPPGSPIIIIKPPVGTLGDLATIQTATANMTVDSTSSIEFGGDGIWVIDTRAEGESLLTCHVQLPSDGVPGLCGVTVRGRANGRAAEAHGVFRLRRR